MDNDFMKHLEHGQVTATSVLLVIREISFLTCLIFLSQLIYGLTCADPHHHGLYASHQPGQRQLCDPGGR